MLNHKTSYVVSLFLLFNAMTLGLEFTTLNTAPFEQELSNINYFFLCLFSIEYVVFLFAFGEGWMFVGENGFHVLEGATIVLAWLVLGSDYEALGAIRLIRIVSLLPQLKLMLESISKAWPSIMQTFGIMLMIYYIYAILVTYFYGDAFSKYFGHLTLSMETLYALAVFDNWSDITGTVSKVFPYSFLVFVSFTLIISIIILNLFIALLTITFTVDGLSNTYNKRVMGNNDDMELVKNNLKKIERKLDSIIRENSKKGK